ncbi:hypothetical protein BHUM_02862c [Candidatus Burkholderia humilis]|nr:hypothetical protein BHUM_02862c [Candidatus Burkholderia humilis]
MSGALAIPAVSHASSLSARLKALVLIDLDGGNDGLNTVIPYTNSRYYALRPNIAVARERAGLHPSLGPLMPAWNAGQLAIVQGVGYAMPNRSHFRSQQIWQTASRADEYLDASWLAGVGVETAITRASFVESCGAASREIVKHDDAHGVKVLRLTLRGFDTHEAQPWRHASVLSQLARGLASLRFALMHSGDWPRTLVMSVSEFGRSAQENAARGTEHGAASVQFLMGGRVAGGLYGAPPHLDALDEAGGLAVGIDFRRLYATALDACCVAPVLEPLALLRV